MSDVEFSIKTFTVWPDRITGAQGRMVEGPDRAIISLRDGAREDTVDFLLKRAESGTNDAPLMMKALAAEQAGDVETAARLMRELAESTKGARR